MASDRAEGPLAGIGARRSRTASRPRDVYSCSPAPCDHPNIYNGAWEQQVNSTFRARTAQPTQTSINFRQPISHITDGRHIHKRHPKSLLIHSLHLSATTATLSNSTCTYRHGFWNQPSVERNEQRIPAEESRIRCHEPRHHDQSPSRSRSTKVRGNHECPEKRERRRCRCNDETVNR